MMSNYTEIFLIGCVFVLPALCKTVPAFRYFFKFFIVHCILFLNAVVLLPVFACRPRNLQNCVLGSTFCKVISPLIGIEWCLRGKEYLSQDKSFIIVANHQSSLDVLGMFELWHIMGKCTVISKVELLYIWPYGPATWLCGIVFIPRSKGDKSKKIMNDAVESIKRNNTKLWIFPEGTRHDDGKIHDFKKGAFHLAINSQIPILPIVFSKYQFLDFAQKRFDSGKVIVTVLPPISTDGKTGGDVNNLVREIKDKMTLVFNEVNREISSSVN